MKIYQKKFREKFDKNDEDEGMSCQSQWQKEQHTDNKYILLQQLSGYKN